METPRNGTTDQKGFGSRPAEKDVHVGTISVSIGPSATFLPAQLEAPHAACVSEPLPLYLCLEDFHQGMKPVAWIPETVGRALLRSEILCWSEENPKEGQILEYWCESTDGHTLVKPLALHDGCWVIPVERMAECSDCVSKHMQRFAKLCEEALSLSHPADCRSFAPFRYNPKATLNFHSLDVKRRNSKSKSKSIRDRLCMPLAPRDRSHSLTELSSPSPSLCTAPVPSV